ERELLVDFRAQHLLVGAVGPAGEPVREVVALRVAAGQQRGAGRRADGAGGGGGGEGPGGGSQGVEGRRPGGLGAVAAEVGPAEVVGEDQDDVRFLRRAGPCGRSKCADGNAEECEPEHETIPRPNASTRTKFSSCPLPVKQKVTEF